MSEYKDSREKEVSIVFIMANDQNSVNFQK